MNRIKLRDPLRVEEAEHAAASAIHSAQRGEAIELDLTRVSSFQVGAAARLGNCVRRVGHSARLVIELPQSGNQLQSLLRTGIGPQLATNANALQVNGTAQTRRLRNYLGSAPVLPETTLLLGQLKHHELFVPRDRGLVRTALRSWLARFPNAGHRLPNGEEVGALATLIHESASNVQDHSDKSPLVGSAPVHSYVLLGWRSASEISLVPSGFKGEDESSRYLALAKSTGEWGTLGGLLEILVVDDGTGIARRQSLDANIDEDPDVKPELNALAEALTAGGTVKLRARDCPIEMTPGYGSEVIADTVSDLAAFVSIRSGRLLAYLNGLQQRGSSDPSFIVDTTVRAPIAGTIVSLIVPVFSQAVPPQDRPQPQPSLF